MLISPKLFPAPALTVKSNYVCVFDESLCNLCGACVDRCTVGAFQMKDEKIEFLAERCIGCGLCVTTCTGEALKLEKKVPEKLYTPPATVFDTFDVMSREKAK